MSQLKRSVMWIGTLLIFGACNQSVNQQSTRSDARIFDEDRASAKASAEATESLSDEEQKKIRLISIIAKLASKKIIKTLVADSVSSAVIGSGLSGGSQYSDKGTVSVAEMAYDVGRDPTNYPVVGDIVTTAYVAVAVDGLFEAEQAAEIVGRNINKIEAEMNKREQSLTPSEREAERKSLCEELLSNMINSIQNRLENLNLDPSTCPLWKGTLAQNSCVPADANTVTATSKDNSSDGSVSFEDAKERAIEGCLF